jgi:OMF family outer membrane factor
LVRKQDLNEAEVNTINFKDKIEQANLSLQQQYITLQVLCETEDTLMVNQTFMQGKIDQQLKAFGDLNEKNALLQQSFAHAEYKAALWQNMPTLSFVTSFNYQNNSNSYFLDNKNPWINSNFWSLRLAWDFPTNINKLTTLKSNSINLTIAEINTKHALLQTKLLNEQMEQDYQKSVSQFKNNQLIYQLKLESYQKSNNQFNANVLPLEKLLIAHNDLLISEINVVTSLTAIAFNKSKIEISNQVK